MRLLVVSLFLSVLVAFGIVGCSNSETSGSTSSNFSIGAGTTGGGFHTGATALSNVINDKVSESQASVQVTGASVDNVGLLQEGEIKIGFSSTETAYEAYKGEHQFDGKSHDKLRTVFPGWPGVYMFVTFQESGIENIEDLQGKSYSSGPSGSSNQVFADRVFETFNIEPNTSNLPTDDAANALKDGTIEGFSIAWPASAVTRLETSHKLNIVTLNEEQKKKFSEVYPQYLWLSIPPDTYESIPKGVENFGLYNLLLASKDVSNETIYEIVKAAYENKDMIEEVMPQMAKGMSMENLGSTTIPYHPGAVEYFEEQGVEIPNELLPPGSE
ncbi:hypothetical protein SAMN04488072_1116 [Lentibacillus halodurans]|uniref:TRAP transporter solute receptor, TAXI family n=1 Tax=Lentibacillus halodurans TaxID=237679 RepID=A0A1I0ZF21_9BACI|nr:TAXI family TRAP transporter solute-binding subunit [Lentibacillus halodurans]SFB23997.1 hypothetical protein SAMN04488072_1116 [Lentibacillus halodurans]